jgi:uroporphyrinogen decarboxylase
MHCDGSIYSLIPDLIEIGVDILNPVQYSAGGMDLERLKREFGNDLCFWGGGIDTQEALPFWKPEEIRDQIKRNIDILAPGGGFVFGTVHNVVEGVPVENVLATFETALECGVY